MLSVAVPLFVIVTVRVTETGIASRSVGPKSRTFAPGLIVSIAEFALHFSGIVRFGLVVRSLATVSVASSIATRFAGSQTMFTTNVSLIPVDAYCVATDVGQVIGVPLRVQLAIASSPVIVP